MPINNKIEKIKKITPYFLINIKKIKKQFCIFKNSIVKYNRNDIIAYAVKANYDEKIINALNEKGAYFEAGSFYEFSLLKKLKIDDKKIIINGSIINSNIMNQYLSSKALLIVDSYTRLKYLENINFKIKIGIRINLDYIKTNNEIFKEKNSRFGIDANNFNFYNILKNKNIKIVCLHAHISQNTKEPGIYYTIVNELCQIIKKHQLKDVKKIDVGGGYKIHTKFWKFEDYTKNTLEALKNNNMEYIQLIYEPGNSMVGASVSYHIKIIDKKNINDITYLITDGTRHHIELLIKSNFLKYKVMKSKKYKTDEYNKIPIQVIAGCTCKASDIFITLKDYQELNIGDMIIFYDAGSYTINRIPNFLIENPNIYYL